MARTRSRWTPGLLADIGRVMTTSGDEVAPGIVEAITVFPWAGCATLALALRASIRSESALPAAVSGMWHVAITVAVKVAVDRIESKTMQLRRGVRISRVGGV